MLATIYIVESKRRGFRRLLGSAVSAVYKLHVNEARGRVELVVPPDNRVGVPSPGGRSWRQDTRPAWLELELACRNGRIGKGFTEEWGWVRT